MASAAATTYTGNGTESEELHSALERIFAPLARLCLKNGTMFAEAEETLKLAFVEAARELGPETRQHGIVSRVSAATGIGRREVTRLVRDARPRRSPRPSLASEVIARWVAEPAYRDESGKPVLLKRQGESPSFEALARSITRDVHPRSILEELLRLGIVSHEEGGDHVRLLCSEHVPGSNAELLTLLGDNVGDHLESAVANLVQDDIKHHDQAIFADELSRESVKSLAPLIRKHWQQLRDELVPALTDCIETDRQAGRQQDQRVRIGLYSYAEQAR